MLKRRWLLVLLALAAPAAWPQQELAPSTQDGPINTQPAQPKPDKDGVYAVGPGIVPPAILHAEAATYPADAPVLDRAIGCFLSAVIGVDGAPSNVQVVRRCNSAFTASAIEAVQRSQFQPGALDGKPVPVLVHLRVVFKNGGPPPIPRLALLYKDEPCCGPPRPKLWDKPPVAVYAPPAPFSEEARRMKIQGVVIVSLLVTEEGLPSDIRLEKSAGAGLDEEAMQTVSQYRFKPAMKDGQPVAARITVEVNFRLY
jgi:TonB family protein